MSVVPFKSDSEMLLADPSLSEIFRGHGVFPGREAAWLSALLDTVTSLSEQMDTSIDHDMLRVQEIAKANYSAQHYAAKCATLEAENDRLRREMHSSAVSFTDDRKGF